MNFNCSSNLNPAKFNREPQELAEAEQGVAVSNEKAGTAEGALEMTSQSLVHDVAALSVWKPQCLSQT